MLNAQLLVNIFVSISFITMGAVVIIKNYYALLNRLFLLFSVFLSGWLLTNYYSNNFDISLAMARVFNHLVLVTSGFMLLFLLWFVAELTHSAFFAKRKKIIIGISSVSYLLALTPLVVNGIVKQESVYAINFGPLAAVYFIVLLASAGTIFVLLAKAIKHAQGNERRRLWAILLGLIVMLGVNIGTNVLLPIISGNFILTSIGPISSFVLVAALFYSIIRHRLFDLRLLVARALAYLLAVAVFGFAFALLATVLIDGIFITNVNLTFTQLTMFAALAIALTFLFPSFKRFFDKYTNRLFFRDAYDTQVLLDQLNKVLVSNIELKPLLKQTNDVIERNVKSEFSGFVISGQGDQPARYIGSKALTIDSALLIDVLRHDPIIMVDELSEANPAKTQLRQQNIAVVIKLVNPRRHSDFGTHYLLLGDKKSGNPYTRQDARFLLIIANELVIAIQNGLRFEEIQNFNLTLQEKVNAATKQLRSANEKLKELDATKDDFIGIASHQLRTPLTSVKGYISMVLDGDVGKITHQQKQMLDQAFLSAQRMVYLIADLLNLSRLRTGKFVIEPIKTSLADLVQNEVDQLAESAKNKGITLEYKKPKSCTPLMIDHTKMSQVVMNFIDNALFYTPKGKKVSISISETPQSLQLLVEDEGMGVPKSEQHHLFTKFYRAKNAKKVRPDGTGLGLFMAKKVIVAQGGSIVFKSAEGKGSTFGFILPKKHLETTAK